VRAIDAMSVRVNAIVELLARHDGAVLDRLRIQYPEYRDILTVGTTMGVGKAASPGGKTASPSAFYVDLAVDGLQAARRRLDPNLRRLRDRLRHARRVRLTGQIVATLTSTALIGAILGGWDTRIIVSTAVVSFAAALCSMFAGYLERPLDKSSGSLIDSLEAFTSAAVEAEEVIQRLEIVRERPTEESVVMEQVTRANTIAAKLRLGERMLWGG
jgi:hypothetical protein